MCPHHLLPRSAAVSVKSVAVGDVAAAVVVEAAVVVANVMRTVVAASLFFNAQVDP